MPKNYRDFDKNSSDENDSSSDEESTSSLNENEEDGNMSEDSEDLMDESQSNINDINKVEEDNTDDVDDELVKAIKAEKNKLRDHPPAITCEDFIVDITFSPVKNMIALANIVGDVLLYEYNNEETKLIATHELHLKACRAVEFDVDGRIMYTSSKDLTIMATDVETGKLKKCYENAHDEPVYSLHCLDNNKIVTGADVFLATINIGRRTAPVEEGTFYTAGKRDKLLVQNNSFLVTLFYVVFITSTAITESCDDGGTVKLWDMRKPDPVFTIKVGEEYVSDMVTNEAQKYLVCSGGDGALTSIDLKASKIYTTSEEYDSELTCMGLFRTETKLLVGSSTGKLYLFNWKQFGLHSDEFVGQKHAIQCMIPITQNIVVTSGEDGILRAAHMFPQRQLGIVGQHRMPVEVLDISHDGQYIASCSHDNDVKFWNISYFESIESIIDVNHKQNKKKDLVNNLPSSSVKNASDFFSGLV